MNHHPCTVLALLGLASSAEAANIIANSLANSPDGTESAKRVLSSTGETLPAGSLVRIGFFDLSLGEPAALTGDDFAAIDAMFVALGEDPTSAADGTTGPIRINADGQVAGSIQNVPGTYAPPESELYVWVLNQPTAGPATEWALFRDARWLVPNEIGSINLATWQINEPSEMLKGTLDLTARQIRLAVIPAPRVELRVETFTHQGRSVALAASGGQQGWTYELQRSPDLSQTSWTTIHTLGPLAAAGPVELTDPVSPADQAFYRILGQAP